MVRLACHTLVRRPPARPTSCRKIRTPARAVTYAPMMLRAASESSLPANGESSPPLQLSFLLADFAARGGLDDATAAHVASLAWAHQQCDDEDDPSESERWDSVGALVEQSGLDYTDDWEQQELAAAEERRRSRDDDARLGRHGPAIVPDFAPVEKGFAATPSIGALQPKDVRVGTFGASRGEADGEGARRIEHMLRFQPPGPGSYAPELDVPPTFSPSAYRLQNGRSFPQGARWGKDDRWKHLARTNYTNKTSAVPMTCGELGAP